jgi:NAD(P)-dependent dehydrogenase (short-subunit alcohol dehydrogenase family)
MKISNATVLVTGANRGIGLALVHALLDAGASRVYAAARNTDQLANAVKADPARVVPVQLDVTDAASVEAAARTVGSVDILLNNAGALYFGNLLEMPLEHVLRDIDVNCLGTLRVVRAFAPLFLQGRDAAVVNLLSVVSLANAPGLGGYSASKAAAWSMTQAIRATLAGRGVSVHGVYPGPVDTDMAKDLPMDKTPPDAVARAIVSGIEAGEEDIFPDPMALQVAAGWKQDHKAVERQFAAM